MNFNGILLRFLLIYFTIPILTDSSRILGIFPLHAKSHNNMFKAIMKGLAKRGHKVDIITHFELKDPPNNYQTIINLNGTKDSLMNAFPMSFISSIKNNMAYRYATIVGNELCELLSHEKMQKFIKHPPNKYDLIITEVSKKCL